MLRDSNLNVSRLVFWQNIISPHQIPYMRELLNCYSTEEIALVVSEPQRSDLAVQGWVTPITGRLDISVRPDSESVENILSREPEHTIHLLSGMNCYPYGRAVLKRCKQMGYRCSLICEGGDFRGVKGLLRRVIYFANRVRYRNCVDIIFAMGQNGVRWYLKAGWPRKKIFPFAYVTEKPTGIPSCIEPQDNEDERDIRLLFVGQMIPRKGVDVLLCALAECGIKDGWRLTLVGTGANSSGYQDIAKGMGIADKTEFLGTVPNPKVYGMMAAADLLLLPSRFDGWGAVVNEALMCGTPVLCSDACGAKDLIADSKRGEVVEAGNATKWADAIGRWIAKGALSDNDRKINLSWSEKISGRSVADYFIAVLNSVYDKAPRPNPPWLGV